MREIFSNLVQKLNKHPSPLEFAPYTHLDFNEIERKALELADRIEKDLPALTEILLKYESYEVVRDEVSRTLDLLRNLKENEPFFRMRSGATAAFLPRNQPLYAFACFVVVPSLMASETYFRIPHSMKYFFPEMLELLDIKNLFPNIIVSSKDRTEFLRERTAVLINPKNKEIRPVTDVVIFTGRPSHADQLRFIFDKRTLFITNGSGHNPVVVSADADLHSAVEAVLTLQLYNQGQDCAAPNAILVHKDIFPKFISLLREEIGKIRIGSYGDRDARIGPISDPEALVEIENFLVEHREWLDDSTPGVLRSKYAIVEPTIVCKPLARGGNFTETFAPIIVIQEYKKDYDLASYFEDQRYASNAMYLTLYGMSEYIESLAGASIAGKVLHPASSIIRNTHLHAPGVERGVEPYGGYGYSASNISINGKITPKPTLPQRDIFEQIIQPILRKKKTQEELQHNYKEYSDIEYKNVEKLLKIKVIKEDTGHMLPVSNVSSYLDVNTLKVGESHFVQVDDENIFTLLKNPNAQYISSLHPEDVKTIRSLNDLLARKNTLDQEEFRTLLYSISKRPNGTEAEDRERQKQFFQHIYHLLFGRSSGPRLTSFLWEVNDPKIGKLLNL